MVPRGAGVRPLTTTPRTELELRAPAPPQPLIITCGRGCAPLFSLCAPAEATGYSSFSPRSRNCTKHPASTTQPSESHAYSTISLRHRQFHSRQQAPAGGSVSDPSYKRTPCSMHTEACAHVHVEWRRRRSARAAKACKVATGEHGQQSIGYLMRAGSSRASFESHPRRTC